MKELGNLLIVLGIIIIFASIVMGVNDSAKVKSACIDKGGVMVKGSNGWICAKLEKL